MFAFWSVVHPGAVLVNWNKCVFKHSEHLFEVSRRAEACMTGFYT